MVARERLTSEAFDHIASLPENRDKRLEFIAGYLVESMSTFHTSVIGATILAHIGNHVYAHQLGHVTGADGGYTVLGERYVPNGAFISYAKQLKLTYDIWNPNAPDLAVEVLSPTDEPSNLRIKIVNYLRAGTTVWVVDPAKQQVEIYVPDKAPQTLTVADTLTGGVLLPDFELAVKDIFPDQPEPS